MNVKIGRTVDVQKQTLEIFFGRCLNEAADLELDEHAEAGVTLVEELLTDFLQVSNHRSRCHSQSTTFQVFLIEYHWYQSQKCWFGTYYKNLCLVKFNSQKFYAKIGASCILLISTIAYILRFLYSC